jgi:hypothetical protein
MPDKTRVLLGIPHYSPRIDVRVVEAAYRHATRQPERFTITVERRGQSLLTNGFNHLLADALTGGYDRMVMLHADVEPRPGWLDILDDELLAHEADVVSCVIPIKGPYGVTSTGIGQLDDPWDLVRRFTMHEVIRFPETFSAEDAGYPGHPLCVNTGCWMADLRKEWWCRKTDGDGVLLASFSIDDRIRLVDGEWKVECQPEDWRWSRKLWELGCKVLATRKVQVIHHGDGQYTNSQAWGRWTHDIDALDKPEPAQKPIRVYPVGASPILVPGLDREELLERLPKGGVIAEIGVWKGDFAERILDVCKPSHLYLIDPWRIAPELPEEAWYGGSRTQDEMDGIHDDVQRRFAGRATILRGPSHAKLPDLPDHSLDAVYIDGSHLYPDVSEDLRLARQKVKPGGTIAGDDYHDSDAWYDDQVMRAVDDFVAGNHIQSFERIRTQFLITV